MSIATCSTVVGVFNDRHEADRAIDDLVKAGFRNDQIGVVTRDAQGKTVVKKQGEAESYAGSGAVVALPPEPASADSWGWEFWLASFP